MAVEMFTDGLEPDDVEARVWRFMTLAKFEDLIASGELYFCRADRFRQDEREGLPPEEYIRLLGLNPLDVNERLELNHRIGSIAQFREAFYVNCWYLFDEERAYPWKEYGQDGVAICSRYNLLKSVLGSIPDRPHLGLVRYGSAHLRGWNALSFVTTKREMFKQDREVRALLWVPDQNAGINRHFDADNRPHERPLTPPPETVPVGLRRKVDLRALVQKIVVTPQASADAIGKIEELVRTAGYAIPVRKSDLTRYVTLLPSERGPF
jgi:hypothetical protein